MTKSFNEQNHQIAITRFIFLSMYRDNDEILFSNKLLSIFVDNTSQILQLTAKDIVPTFSSNYHLFNCK